MGMATFGNKWQILETFGNKWQLLATNGNFLQQMATFGNKWQLLATNGNIWQQMANFGNKWRLFNFCIFWKDLENFGHYCVDSLAVSDSQWECAAVCNSPWQFSGSQGSLCQSVAIMTICGSQWQSVAVIANLYQPERRRREGQLRTPHDPMLAFSRIFSISRNSQSP